MVFDRRLIEDYKKQGFLVIPNLIDRETVENIREQVNSILDKPDERPEGVVLNLEGSTIADKSSSSASNKDIRGAAFLVRFIPFFQDIAKNPNLLQFVRAIIGPKIRVFRDQALFKPPGGQKKPVHQDQSYFRINPPDELITAWIAIDDATTSNGCMHYIPESHQHGLFPIEADPERPVHHIPKTNHINLPTSRACPVTAGSVIFHHGCTLHFSETNHSHDWRRAIIFHYTTKTAISENMELNNQISLELE